MNEIADPSQTLCLSDNETSACTFTWTIHNFMSKGEKVIESSEFNCRKNDEISWTLKIFPRGTSDKLKDYTSVFLNLKSFKQASVNVPKFSISIKDKENLKTCERKVAGICFEHVNADWGWKEFVRRGDLFKKANQLLPGGKLTIFLEMIIEESPPVNQTMEASQPKFRRLNKLCDDQNKMFINATFSDIIIVVGNQEIKAHKNILASRSPVFSAMLQSEMQEAAENSVKIPDIDYDVVIELLRYLYTGHTEKIYEMAAKLLYAADKYQVKDLKELCEDALQQQLSVENACDILILANLHSCNRLEAATLQFIRLKIADVMESEGFARLTEAHLIKKILRKTALKICQCEQ